MKLSKLLVFVTLFTVTTLSAKEIIGNESQERMGIAIHEKDVALLKKVSERERAPMYVVGTATGEHRFVFANKNKSIAPVDLEVKHLFGSSPKIVNFLICKIQAEFFLAWISVVKKGRYFSVKNLIEF